MVLGFALALGLSSGSPAGMLLTPNGDPTGAAAMAGTGGAAFLNPVAAFETAQPQVGPLSDDDLLVTALAAQGFSAAKGYTFAFTALAGNDLTLGTYLAWADNRPAFTQGTLTAPAATLTGTGGADIGIGYAQNNMADPTTANLHWISIVEDNNPTAFETANGVADPLRNGFTLSVDNPFAPQVGGKPTTPFYDAGGLANGSAFLDAPNNPLNRATQLIFHTFVVTQNAKAFTIYDDVTWGVQTVVPEPGSIVLVLLGGTCVSFQTWRRRGRAA